MRLLIQYVKNAHVTVNHEMVAQIEKGYLVYVGFHKNDTKEIAKKMSLQLRKLRIIPDQHGKLNLSIVDTKQSLLLVSQFTLYGNTKTGNRPSFIDSMLFQEADVLFQYFIDLLKEDIHVETGVFGAQMEVSSINDGPITILMEENSSLN